MFLQKPDKSLAEACKNASSTERYNCWETNVKKLLEEKGMDSALTAMGELYVSDKNFFQQCHSLAHVVGQDAYLKFAESGRVDVTAKMSYCSYGTYHGFMEALLQKGGNINKAREFCTYLTKELGGKVQDTSAIEDGCYHGIGHGVTDGDDPRVYGNPRLIVQPGLSLCMKVGNTAQRFQECATGVFNSLALMEARRQYGLAPPSNPYAICDSFKGYTKQACYEQMNTLVFDIIADKDFSRAVSLALAIPDRSNIPSALAALSAHFAFVSDLLTKPATSDVDSVKTCQAIAVFAFRRACILGLVAGLMEHGAPDKDYLRAQSFCNLTVMNQAERRACFGVLVSNVKVRYDAERSKQICKTIGVDNC